MKWVLWRVILDFRKTLQVISAPKLSSHNLWRTKPTKTSLIINDRLVMKQWTLGQKLIMMESNSRTFKRSHLIRAPSTLHHGLRAQKEWLQCLKPHLNSKETKWKRAHLEAPKIIPNKVTWEIMLSILGKGWLSSKDPINRKGNKALSSLSQKVHAFKGFSKDRTL